MELVTKIRSFFMELFCSNCNKPFNLQKRSYDKHANTLYTCRKCKQKSKYRHKLLNCGIDWEATKNKYGYTFNTMNMRDKVIAKCIVCNKDIIITYRGINSLLKSVKTITHSKCYTPNDATINKIKKASNDYWNKEESHLLASKIIKEKWKDNNFRNKILNSLKNSLKNTNACINWSYSKRHEFTKKLWESKDYSDKILPHLKGHMRINMINLWKDENYKERMSNTAFFIPKPSKLQKKFGKILEELNINYIEEYKIRWWRFDYYLPEFNILIEVQGKYWHTRQDIVTRDKKKRSFVKNNTNMKLYEVWEDEFKDLEKLIEKIQSIIYKSNIY